jgi:hypothetical protein
MLIHRWLSSTSATCVLGVALLGSAQTQPQPQRCGDIRTIWTNATSKPKSVTAAFKANCNEREESGEVSVYDASGAKVLSFTILRGSSAAIPSATITFDVPGNGHVDYSCHPPHDTPGDQCTSQIVNVSNALARKR